MVPYIVGTLAVAIFFLALFYLFRAATAERQPVLEAAPGPEGAPAAEADAALDIEITDWGGVIVGVEAGEAVLIVLPVLDEAARERALSGEIEGVGIEAIVAVNDQPGHLWPVEIAEHLGLDPSTAVWALDGAQAPGVQALDAPESFGPVTISADRCGVAVTHAAGDMALVGCDIPLEAIGDEPHPTHVIGSVSLSSVSGQSDAIIRALADLEDVALLANVYPGRALSTSKLLHLIGIDVIILRPEDAAAHRDFCTELLLAETGPNGTGEPASPQLFDPSAWSGAVLDCIIEGELGRADRLAVTAKQHVDEGAVDFHRGVIRLMGGEAEAALSFFEAAIDADLPYEEARVSLAATLLALGRIEEARAAAQKSLTDHPDDPIAAEVAVRIEARAGDLDRARQILDDHREALGDQQTARLSLALEHIEAEGGAEEPVEHRFSAHAILATERAEQLIQTGQTEAAERLLRRALELDPQHLAAAGELGYLMSEGGDDRAALEWYDAQIERIATGELLRFNKGNCLLRMQRLGEATEEYERCVELVPGWIEPRINAISVYCMLGHASAAERHRDALGENDQIDDELLAELSRQIEALRSR